jgi:putative nucleotidyltransferase with HDIG domain
MELIEGESFRMNAVLEALPHEFQQFREVVEAMAKLVLQARLFPIGHPAIDRALGAAFMHVDSALQGKGSVKIAFSDGVMRSLNFEIDMTDSHDKAMHLLREALVRHSVGEIEFVKGMTKEELRLLAGMLAAGVGKGTGEDAVTLGAGIRNIRLRNVRAPVEPEAPRVEEPARPSAQARLETDARSSAGGGGKMGKLVRDVLSSLEKIATKEGARAGAKVIELIEREGGDTATILLLNSLRTYDDYTFSHSVNVAVVSAAIARTLGLGDDFVASIAHAALLHDIGKIYVPREVIHKCGHLTPAEWQMVKRHPVDGERILREERFDLVARRVAYEHHMRHDLTGYPAPKEGFEVHKASEIVRIADSYDALTTRRPYRRQISPYEAVKLMAKGSGTEFHPDYFGAFLRVLGNVPIGSILKLDTGETVLVVDIIEGSEDLPRVRVLSDASGAPVEDEIILDLNERDPATAKLKRRIVLIVDQPVRDVEIGQYIAD